MIKINLLGQRKKGRRREISSSGPPAPMLLFVAIGAIALLLGVYFLVHRPLSTDVDELAARNATLKEQNEGLRKDTKNSRTIRTAFEGALARQKATQRLKLARVTPAWLMRELANILTPGHQPQLTPKMQAELKDNPNRPWQDGWDPKHVWLISFEERAGHFVLRGGARSKGDFIELGLRLGGSMFFDRLTPTETDATVDKENGLTYHKFAYEGNVRY